MQASPPFFTDPMKTGCSERHCCVERSRDGATGNLAVRRVRAATKVAPFGCQSTPVAQPAGPLAELGRKSRGANVAGWLNATVPARPVPVTLATRPGEHRFGQGTGSIR